MYLIQKMDVNRDGVVTLDEFLECCRNDDAISRSMAVFDTSFWPHLDNAAVHAAVNVTNASTANVASGTMITDCSNQRHVAVGGLSNPLQHYHPDRHQPQSLRHHHNNNPRPPLTNGHEHQLTPVCNCSNSSSNNHHQHDINHLNQNNQQNSSLVVSSHQQQIPPDSPSLVKVKSWYTVAKQGVSC